MIEEVEALGGMTKAVEQGLPKARIEEAATLRQARVDKVEDIVVGVNQFVVDDEDPIDILEIDNVAVRESQIARLKKIKKERDDGAVQDSLKALESTAATGEGNLLEAAIAAARTRATLGEITAAMEQVFGRHNATTRVISGVYAEAYADHPEYKILQGKIEDFVAENGRPPFILISKMGQDGHDRGAKIIATAFADMGFKVELAPLFETSEEVAKKAIELDVDLVGVSSLTAGHKTLVPELIDCLKDQNREDIQIVCGGVIPEQDYDFLKQAGVAGIFGPGTNVIEAANALLALLSGLRRNR